MDNIRSFPVFLVNWKNEEIPNKKERKGITYTLLITFQAS